MPSTEVPTSPPGRPPEPFSRRKRVRYEELEPDELLHLIDRLEDERSRALRREGIWISFIAHLILFWFLFYGPKFRSHQPHVVNPDDNQAEGPDLSEPSARCAEAGQAPEAGPAFRQESHRAIAPPDARRKTLQQLEAMSKAGPPIPAAPQPAPSRQPRRPRRPASATGTGSSGNAAAAAATTAVAAQRAQAGPHAQPDPALTPARRTPETPFARQNGTLPRTPACPRAITGRMRPPSIRPWGSAPISSATPWGSTSALICGG